MLDSVDQPAQSFGPDPKRGYGNTGKFGATKRVIFAVIKSDDGYVFRDRITPIDKSSAKQISHPIAGTDPRSDPILHSSDR